MVNLKIDGKQVQVEHGATILAAAELVGSHIPTLCFLKKVSPTGACRVCVVEIEGVDKPMTACNTPVTEGMVVTTRSEKLATIRRQIVELLLVNHPLDCPVCDAAGECDLQNICYELDVVQQPFAAEDVNHETIDRWPLIQQVPNRCVMCEKCVKVCHETIGSSALSVNEKGDRAFIDKDLDKCEFCGNCVAVCPTGTMISKPFKFRARCWELTKVPSVCTACGCQCQVDLNVKGNTLFRVTAEDASTVNNGNLCVGGYFGHDYVHAEQRLETPQLRNGESLVDASWDDALTAVAERMQAVRKEFGSDALAGLGSPRLTNEEHYLFQKLFRAGVGSNNIDSEARFGAQRAATVLRNTLGLRGSSHPISHIGKADAVLVFGCDVTAEAPAVDWQIEEACRRNDGKLIVANMRKVKLSRHANVNLEYRPGSEVALANALCRLLLDFGLVDLQQLKNYVGNFDAMQAHLATIDVDAMVETTGLSRKLLEEVARELGAAGSVAVIFGADLTKAAQAEEATSAVANLALLTGALFSDAGGLFPIDEKGNMQGLLEMGVCPESFPGFQDYTASRATFEKLWQVTLPEAGRDALAILEGIEQGAIRFLYLAATNPLVSFPMAERWRKALDKVEFLVVQDILASELTAMADVILPGCSAFEKTGSVIALDSRVNCLSKGIDPVGEAREDWEILAELCQRLGGQSVCLDNSALLQEIRTMLPLYEGVCFAGDGHGQRCMKTPFQLQAGAALFTPLTATTGKDAGLQLLSGKILAHFGTTSTFAPSPLELAASGFVEMHADDARVLGVEDGTRLRIVSAAAEILAPVRISASVPPGLLFAPYHFADTAVQRLMPGVQNRVDVKVSRA
jgi:formate dehydrogenase alpha subunit